MNTTYNSAWDALEDAPEMAEYMKLRSRLMMEIRELIENRQHPPTEAARQLGMTQPRFDDLMTGEINQFSLDDLVVADVRAGLSVDMRIREAALFYNTQHETGESFMTHTFTLDYWTDNGWYVGKLREVLGVFSQGETLAELEENIGDAYMLMLEDEVNHPKSKFKEIMLEVA